MPETTPRAIISSVTIFFTCPTCENEQDDPVEMEQDIGPGWETPMQDRWHLCQACGAMMDAGFNCSIGDVE